MYEFVQYARPSVVVLNNAIIHMRLILGSKAMFLGIRHLPGTPGIFFLCQSGAAEGYKGQSRARFFVVPNTTSR